MGRMNRPDPRIDGYRILDTPLGAMALGAHDDRLRGVILPRPGKTSADDLVAELWPAARSRRGVLPDLVLQVRAYWSGRCAVFRVQLDLEGFPPFYGKVWREAMRIPPGEVRTYGQLAAAAGSPAASRAVGGAMAANPMPLVVPCHRVVAASSLGGFSAPGGLDLKRALLDRERQASRV